MSLPIWGCFITEPFEGNLKFLWYTSYDNDEKWRDLGCVWYGRVGMKLRSLVCRNKNENKIGIKENHNVIEKKGINIIVSVDLIFILINFLFLLILMGIKDNSNA